jgi:hypothetical protein
MKIFGLFLLGITLMCACTKPETTSEVKPIKVDSVQKILVCEDMNSKPVTQYYGGPERYLISVIRKEAVYDREGNRVYVNKFWNAVPYDKREMFAMWAAVCWSDKEAISIHDAFTGKEIATYDGQSAYTNLEK